MDDPSILMVFMLVAESHSAGELKQVLPFFWDSASGKKRTPEESLFLKGHRANIITSPEIIANFV